MSREGIPSAVEDVLTGDVSRTVTLVKLDFLSGTVLVHNRLGEIDYDGDTYLGVGNLGSISNLKEGNQVSPFNMTLTLEGLDAQMLGIALADKYQGRPAQILIGELDEANNFIGGGPYLTLHYRMNHMEGFADGDRAAINVHLQTRLTDWARGKPGRYTDQFQKSRYPNDFGLEFVAEMADMEINWGVPTGGSNVARGGNNGSFENDVRPNLR